MIAAPGFQHLDRLSDDRGLFEHADGTQPRTEHGYCTDDNARLLVVTSREPDAGLPARLARLALDVVLAAQAADGRCRNRLDRTGRWTDLPSTDDCWGRALWGLGATATGQAHPGVRRRALDGFDRSVRVRSPWPRAMAFAALGAADVLAAQPDHAGARALLADTLLAIGPLPPGDWCWPEARLSYANAALAEAVIAAGALLGRPAEVERGLAMLGWLLARETRQGHLSVTGVGGRGPGDPVPCFDQQPIEVSAMADACWRAVEVTGDRSWWRGVELAAGWFAGRNDAGCPMADPLSGGSFDGLQPHGPNLNQGAESTLALASTLQRAHALVPAP